jgi:hypothetical protein
MTYPVHRTLKTAGMSPSQLPLMAAVETSRSTAVRIGCPARVGLSKYSACRPGREDQKRRKERAKRARGRHGAQ